MTQLSRIFRTFLRCSAFVQVIVAIDIWLKLDCPVIFDPHGAVHEINRHGLSKYDSATCPLCNGGEKTVARQCPAQHVFGQVCRFFNPYTAMAESPFGFGKQCPRRGIVEIHLEAVGKHELDIPKGIFRSRFLTQTIGKVSASSARHSASKRFCEKRPRVR